MAKYEVSIDGAQHEIEIVRDDGRKAVLKVDGREIEIEARNVSSGAAPVAGASVVSAPTLAPRAAPKAPSGGGGALDVVAPLAGLVLQVCVAVGDSVSAGDVVARLEAMKMENDIQAESGGTVKAIPVSQGDEVQEGQVLLQLEA